MEPLALGAISARSPLAALVSDRLGQTVHQRPHTGLKALDVRELTAPRQRPLIMAGLRCRLVAGMLAYSCSGCCPAPGGQAVRTGSTAGSLARVTLSLR